MLSHDLARALLARRNNDVRIAVLIDDDPDGERDVWETRVPLRDDLSDGSAFKATTDQVVTYAPEDDAIVIRAGFVITGGKPDE